MKEGDPSGETEALTIGLTDTLGVRPWPRGGSDTAEVGETRRFGVFSSSSQKSHLQ